jgi:NAD(P)-dependent dehydrogenase (short-subunit alcohol dehydrogenase family)
MELGLKGRKAIVTGATRGIGRAVADILAVEGCDIAFCARTAAKVAETAADLKKHGVAVHGTALNIREVDKYRAWLQSACDALGGLDILIANVSAGAGMDDENDWTRSFETDLMGTVRAVEVCLPAMKKSEAGSIIFMSSVGAAEEYVGPTPQNTLKAALLTYAKQLSQTQFKRGIRVNCVSPGPTEFPGSLWEMTQLAKPRLHKAAVAASPMRRLGVADEIARCVVFLASPAASWVVGTDLVVDGGYSKRIQF